MRLKLRPKVENTAAQLTVNFHVVLEILSEISGKSLIFSKIIENDQKKVSYQKSFFCFQIYELRFGWVFN